MKLKYITKFEMVLKLVLRSGKFSYLSNDLVNLHGLLFWVPTKDNLYSNFISQHNKNQEAKGQTILVRQKVDVFWALLELLHADNFQRVCLLDLGSWVGEFGIRFARCAQSSEVEIRVYCVDPTPPADLVKVNAQLNGVEDCVMRISKAITFENTKQVSFLSIRGHSDSAKIDNKVCKLDFKRKFNIYDAVTINDVRRLVHQDELLILKFDLEGIDAFFLENNLDFLDDIVVFEFAPTRPEWQKWLSNKTYLDWINTHELIDVGYAPNPDRIDFINEKVNTFISNVSNSQFEYTDILAIPKRYASVINGLRKQQHLGSEIYEYKLD